ncbi:MAG: methionine adenosyltransferase [Clostridia bacterium]|nr:methionine adenosyltransferase [Clostridia bacterium]
MNHLFTSESVTKGHPDKVCDQISDAILDAMLKEDKNARVACETTACANKVMIMGEITTTAKADLEKIARETILSIGYNKDEYDFNGENCDIEININKQSPDIAMGVDASLEIKEGDEDTYNLNGAGDQGIMFGYACDETPELMPLPISLAHKLAKRLQDVREDGTLPYLRPDGKTQVTIEYDEDNNPVRVEAIVISSQHDDNIPIEKIRKDLIDEVIKKVIPDKFLDDKIKLYINPTGRFVIGGPAGDSGLTGRKIIVDTYGGYARHGGGCFSGKDPTKVDRSATYAARWVAKNIVAAGLAKRCEIQLSYAIGVAHPISIFVETFGTETVENAKIVKAVKKVFDLRPAAIIDTLDLRRPIYKDLAALGHMGREDLDVPWEKTDKVEALKEAI